MPPRRHLVAATAALLAALTGCTEQMLSNDRAAASIAGSLGAQPSDVTVVSRTSDGPTNTNFVVDVRGAGMGRYVCTINGGGALAFGLTNGAYCRRPGA